MKKKKGQVWLNLGCGIFIRKDFINVDKYIDIEKLKVKQGGYANAIYQKGAKFVKADIKEMPFPDNYADYVEMLNVVEHFPLKEVMLYLKEVYRVMKPGAKLIILTNSMNGLCAEWLQIAVQPPIDMERYINVAEEIYGNQAGGANGGEIHMCPFTYEFLNLILAESGFKEGIIGIIKQGTPVPTIGTVKPITKNSVCRNDLLYAEVKK